MTQGLGGSQISTLLETVPGIASVLRNPVADAIVNMVRASAGLGEFRIEDARELIQFGVRRGLLGPDEGDRLLDEIGQITSRRSPAGKSARRSRKTPAKARSRRAPPKPRKRVSGRAGGRKKR